MADRDLKTKMQGFGHRRRDRERAAYPFARCACGAAIVAFAAACSPATKTFRVEVRDAATHEPGRGVTVFADVPSRNHPFSVASLLGQTGPLGTRGTTNQLGVVELTRIEGRPVRIGVLCAGWAVGEVYIEPDAAEFDPRIWVRTADFDTQGARMPEFLILR